MTNNDPRRTLGNRVYTTRTRLALSQQQLADAAHIGSRNTIADIENGRRSPQASKQADLETALGWKPGTISEILRPPAIGTGPAGRAADLTDEELTAELSYRLRQYRDTIAGQDVYGLAAHTGEPGVRMDE